MPRGSNDWKNSFSSDRVTFSFHTVENFNPGVKLSFSHEIFIPDWKFQSPIYNFIIAGTFSFFRGGVNSEFQSRMNISFLDWNLHSRLKISFSNENFITRLIAWKIQTASEIMNLFHSLGPLGSFGPDSSVERIFRENVGVAAFSPLPICSWSTPSQCRLQRAQAATCALFAAASSLTVTAMAPCACKLAAWVGRAVAARVALAGWVFQTWAQHTYPLPNALSQSHTLLNKPCPCPLHGMLLDNVFWECSNDPWP